MSHIKTAAAPFGTLLGLAPGDVPVYSSDYASVNDALFPDRSAFRSVVDGVYMGYKWQCVELARRYLYHNHGLHFDEVGMAYEIFELRHIQHKDGARLPLRSFRNGSRRPLVQGSLLIWDEGGEFEHTGHVAIVTEVLSDRVRVVEQNYDDAVWPQGQRFSREIPMRVAYDGGYWLKCPPKEGVILGWVIQTDDPLHAEPIVEPDPALLGVHSLEAEGGEDQERSWLNEANPDEAAFVAMMGGHTLVTFAEDRRRYALISETLKGLLRRATNDLHGLFMHATDWVLQDERRLAPFNLPKALWPRLRQSWANRRNQMVTGRFDFGVSERGVKVFEYNCDSASCYMECGKVQGKWADHYDVNVGEDPGRELFAHLVEAWAKGGVDGVLHIMHDDHPEEAYHALYMCDALEAAGIATKTLLGVEGLSFDDKGDIVDEDHTPIRWVWKTWSWETALDQIRAECEDDDLGVRSTGRPRLADVLLRPTIRVFEPLWTLIPSNKAILPVLWQLFPNHPFLLESQTVITDRLRQTGYVSKPIVGRCGDNISLYDSDATLVAETAGRFEERDQIYQELSLLPQVAQRYVQLCTFSVAGTYAGACTRVDPSPVISSGSDIWPLRVAADEVYRRLIA